MSKSTSAHARLILSLWIACVIGLCLTPLEFKVAFHTKGHLHPIGHVCIFFITGLLLAWNSSYTRYLRLVWIPLAMGLGVLTELLEHYIYGSRIEWSDAVLDVIGVLLAALFAAIWASGLSVDRITRLP